MTRADSWTRILRDRRRPLDARAAAARALGALGTDETVATLATALDDSPWTLRARIAESLGLADHPRARGLVGTLFDDPQEEVACAAVRALAWRAADEAVAGLASLLGDGARSLRMRCAAARALASVGDRASCEVLARAIADTSHDELREAALAALATRPLGDTRDFFVELLSHADVIRRVAVLEALGDAVGDVAAIAAPFLTDPASAVREAAALAIAAAARAGEIGDRLVAALAREPEAAVRFALYHALGNQVRFAVDRVVRCVLVERSLDLRLAGCVAIAAEVGRRPATAAGFDREVVPALVTWALDAAQPDRAVASVAVLHVANTAATRGALQVIAAEAAAPVADAARAALSDLGRATEHRFKPA